MKSRFSAELEAGHKGCAVIVPFDPSVEWGLAPQPVHSAVYGRAMSGHPVRGTLAGTKFTGWIGHRWGRFFVLVDENFRKAAGVAAGDRVDVVLEPAKVPPSATAKSPRPRRTPRS